MVPMERASVATDGDSRTAMDGAKCPLEWVPQGLIELLPDGKQTITLALFLNQRSK
jgi:hypothetical protein